MPGFTENSGDAIVWLAWVGDPDDDTAHLTILNWLKSAIGSPSFFLSPTASLPVTTKGNLGEFIAYKIGATCYFSDHVRADTANAFAPLALESRTGVDIVWLHLGSSSSIDWVALQEVKTTGDPSLNLADGLNDDYAKLFGEDPRMTLQTRLTSLKNKLDQWNLGDLAPRITALGGPNPSMAHGIRLIPTLVHDAASGHKSFPRMNGVRQVLIGQGWSPASIKCWSILLEDVDERLTRLARGQQ